MDHGKSILVFPPTGDLGYPHLGIPALVAYLKEKNKDVTVMDLNRLYRSTGEKGGASGAYVEELNRRLLRSYRGRDPAWPANLYELASRLASAPGVEHIGFSIVYPNQVAVAVCLAKAIRAANDSVKLFCGGPMVTLNIEEYRQSPEFRCFDFLIVGDGEEALYRILDGATDFSTVPNCYGKGKKDGRFIFSGRSFELAPAEYRAPVFEKGSYDVLPLRMSKGCFYRKCAFCTYKSVYDGYLAADVDTVVGHVRKMVQEWGVKRFTFVDEAIPPRTLLSFAGRLNDSGLKIEWDCSSFFHKDFCDPGEVSVLATAGLKTVFFGFESANKRVLALMRKSNRQDIVVDVLRNLKRCGICSHLNVIIGFPTETREEALQTVRFLKEHRDIIGDFTVHRFSLEYYSDICMEPEAYGITWLYDTGYDTNISTRLEMQFETKDGMNPEQRQYMALKAAAAFRRKQDKPGQYVFKKLKAPVYYLWHYAQIRGRKPHWSGPRDTT